MILTSEIASLGNPLKSEKKKTSVIDDPRIPHASGPGLSQGADGIF